MAEDNIRRFPVERVDRVVRLAQALVNVVELAEASTAEEDLAAILLVQTAMQQAISREKGPAELQRVLIAANERRRKYEVTWSKKRG